MASVEPGTESEAATVARAYFEAVARRDLDAMHAFYAPDGVGEIHGLVELRAGDTYRPWFAGLFAAFPDFAMEILDVMSAGDKAAVRWRARGSFTGEGRFEGLVPNGAAVDIQGCDVLTIRDGRIQRNDAYMNAAEMARQVGALPPRDSVAERALAGAVNLRTRLLARFRGRRS